ncbi:RNA polymerase II transcription factor SIII subunit A-domain-containing protein [Terfezia claveryi]|nr:RNA polymerase II transcription factor SIII subunit A-domain-containing protein [Terfezia claveryi]
MSKLLTRKSEPTSPTQIYPVPFNHVGAPSLFQLATKILIRRVNEIESVGPLLFPHVEPILRSVKYASQLRLIEQNSPQVAGKLPELWKAFIARDFGANPEKYAPENSKNWHKIYAKHGREFDDATSSAANKLKDQLSALSAQKAKLRPTELTGSVAARLAPKSGSGWGRSSGGGGWGTSGDSWNTAHGSRTKDVMRKIKREVGNKKLKLTTPTHELNARRGGGWGGGKGGLNRAMVEKLRRDATMTAPSGLAEERKKMDTEEERERRFRIETAKRLGERRIGGSSVNPVGPTGIAKRPVISKAPMPLPIRAPVVKKGPEKLMGPPVLSQLTRKWRDPVTAGASSSAGGPSSSRPSINTNTAKNRTPISLASAAKPQGICKQQISPLSSIARTNTHPTSSSTLISNLRKLANPNPTTAGSSSSGSPSGPDPRDTLLNPHPVNTNNSPTGSGNLIENRSHWPGMAQKKLIPIVRPKKEPCLFLVKKPAKPVTGVAAGSGASAMVGAGRSVTGVVGRR